MKVQVHSNYLCFVGTTEESVSQAHESTAMDPEPVNSSASENDYSSTVPTK